MRRAQLEAKPPMRATEPVAAGNSGKFSAKTGKIRIKILMPSKKR